MKMNKYLVMFIGIAVLLAIYLFYIDWERKQSIIKYFGNPQVGDIYKMKMSDDEGKWVVYYKVHSFHDDKIAFIPSKLKTDAGTDYLQKQFNEYEARIFTNKELEEIKDGKWNNFQKDFMELIEIVRKEK